MSTKGGNVDNYEGLKVWKKRGGPGHSEQEKDGYKSNPEKRKLSTRWKSGDKVLKKKRGGKDTFTYFGTPKKCRIHN